jgi:drug/metabolite transporter (DMT)-like permease
MGVGAACLVATAWSRGGFAVIAAFDAGQWLAIAYLGAFGGAVAFFLWVWALERTTPTRLASTMTVNPIAASALAVVLVGEPIGPSLLAGVVAVLAGIWIAAGPGAAPAPAGGSRPRWRSFLR